MHDQDQIKTTTIIYVLFYVMMLKTLTETFPILYAMFSSKLRSKHKMNKNVRRPNQPMLKPKIDNDSEFVI